MSKVSIVVPIYNAEKYLVQCLDSIAKQTLKDIDVICVNDGSNDSSLEIIYQYVNSDPRFKVIDKPNSGYGNTMNVGFDTAEGEYIGIVESDDFIAPDMLEALYTCAKENDLDICKSGFFYYYTQPEEKSIPCKIPRHIVKKGTFCPTADFESLKRQIEFFGIKPTIWSAIYKREFIREGNIRFTETSGASFQDTGFNFKAWALAKRVRLLDECFLYYRQDNEGSSINSGSKVFSICDEFREIEAFLDCHRELGQRLGIVMGALKYDAYIWNYERLCESKAGEFLLQASLELERDMQTGCLVKKAFPLYKWNKLNRIIDDPEGYHRDRQAEKRDEVPVSEGEAGGSLFKRVTISLKKNGLGHTIKKLFPRSGKRKKQAKEKREI